MAKLTVNIGTSANDRTGDNLRTAFNKINQNFDELYTSLGLDDNSLNLGAFEFTGSVMTTTDSSAITIDQAVTVSSDLTVGGDVVPSTDLGGNLGSATKQWKSLYVSSNTIFIGGTALSVDNSGNLAVDGTVLSNAANDYTQLINKPTNVSEFINDAGYLTAETDNQTLSLLNKDITISSGNTISLSNFIIQGDAFTGDLEGSVYGNDSTRLVDGTSGLINLNFTSIDSLIDVDTTSSPPTTGQVLKWDGAKWAPAADITSGGAGLDADTLDGFDSSYFLNYNNLNNRPTLGTAAATASTDYATAAQGTKADTAYGWGDHSIEGYLKADAGSITANLNGSIFADDSTLLVDGVNAIIPSSVISGTEATNWNTAYGWGNHASAGYLTVESDTLQTVATRGNNFTGYLQARGLDANNGANGIPKVLGGAVDYELRVGNDGTTANQVFYVEDLATLGTGTHEIANIHFAADTGQTRFYGGIQFRVDTDTGQGKGEIGLQVQDPDVSAGGQVGIEILKLDTTGATILAGKRFYGNVTGNVVGDITGNTSGSHTGSVTGDVTGSVFADDSTLLVDAVSGTIPGNIITGLTITESQISDLQNYLTSEINDLTSAVTWANVPDANITQSSITQHQAALSITESQISDLQSYATVTGATFTGNVLFNTGVQEKFSTISGATGTVTHDCDNGHLFVHSSISTNFTVNLTNLSLGTGYTSTVTLILNQGGTAYIPNALEIGGASQTINWWSGSTPSGTPNAKDIISFTILNDSGTYTVFGQLADF